MKKRLFLPIVLVSLILFQACGDVLTPATPMSTEDELTLLSEEQTSTSETSVSETSVADTSTEASVSESTETSVSET